jgi:hypothetical protein
MKDWVRRARDEHLGLVVATRRETGKRERTNGAAEGSDHRHR